VVRGVRGFAHGGSGEREPTDLNALLDDVLRMAHPQLKDRARVERAYGGLPPVPCNAQDLKHVFLNLILNAAQAIREHGTVRLRTQALPHEVVVYVEDDGAGIAPEILDRIFDPFFTTKKVGEGTGLGLGIAYQIVRNHEGEMEVDSSPGRGTCVRVRLPADGNQPS
jgi:signal transduction histidine kinase